MAKSTHSGTPKGQTFKGTGTESQELPKKIFGTNRRTLTTRPGDNAVDRTGRATRPRPV